MNLIHGFRVSLAGYAGRTIAPPPGRCSRPEEDDLLDLTGI